METKKYFYYGCLYFFALSITIAGQTAGTAPTAASTTGEGPIAGTNQLNQETERDDFSAELSLLRERLDKAMEERDSAVKESDRSQGEVYQLQGKLDTALAEQERLRSESSKTQLLASRAREDILKEHQELLCVKKSQLDGDLPQLSEFKENEEKFKEEQKILRERIEKSENEIKGNYTMHKQAESEYKRALNESNKRQSEYERALNEWLIDTTTKQQTDCEKERSNRVYYETKNKRENAIIIDLQAYITERLFYYAYRQAISEKDRLMLKSELAEVKFELKRTSAQHSMEKIKLNLFYKRQQEEELAKSQQEMARDRQRMEKAERDLADAQRQLQERTGQLEAAASQAEQAVEMERKRAERAEQDVRELHESLAQQKNLSEQQHQQNLAQLQQQIDQQQFQLAQQQQHLQKAAGEQGKSETMAAELHKLRTELMAAQQEAQKASADRKRAFDTTLRMQSQINRLAARCLF